VAETACGYIGGGEAQMSTHVEQIAGVEADERAKAAVGRSAGQKFSKAGEGEWAQDQVEAALWIPGASTQHGGASQGVVASARSRRETVGGAAGTEVGAIFGFDGMP
jgi:hypothetical protein